MFKINIILLIVYHILNILSNKLKLKGCIFYEK
nr:MAG TPA: hypothetical protein [Caudoviricetes sp.]